MNKLNRTICNNVSTNNAPFDQREMEREREREREGWSCQGSNIIPVCINLDRLLSKTRAHTHKHTRKLRKNTHLALTMKLKCGSLA